MAACNRHPQEMLLSWQGPSSHPTEQSNRTKHPDPRLSSLRACWAARLSESFVKSFAQAKEAILSFEQSREPPLPWGTRKDRSATHRGTDNESVASERSLGHLQTGSKSPSWTPRLKHSQIFSLSLSVALGAIATHWPDRHVPRHSLDHLVIYCRGSAGCLLIWLRNKELRKAALKMPLKEAYLNQGGREQFQEPWSNPPAHPPGVLCLWGAACAQSWSEDTPLSGKAMGAPPLPPTPHSLRRHGHSTGSEGYRDSSDPGRAEDTGTKKGASFPRGKASSQSRSQMTSRGLRGPGRGAWNPQRLHRARDGQVQITDSRAWGVTGAPSKGWHLPDAHFRKMILATVWSGGGVKLEARRTLQKLF